MPIFAKWTYAKNDLKGWSYPNYWDFIAICLVLAIIVLFAWGAKGMATPYHLGEPIHISLNPADLPYYAFRSVLRMALALICSLLFTFIVGTAAAKSTHAERFIIPVIDILQSVPVLGYLSVTVVVFIAMFPNSLLGPECAAIFAIFTAQVWNMTLSFYQSLRTVPEDLVEAAHIFRLSAWQRFWRLDVPFAMPGLLWNAMMSMSASWFFVVASEAISVNHQNITLPGIGSYIALAVLHADMRSVVYAIIAMFIVILIYDQILFRPLNEWTDKFKFEQLGEEPETHSWVVKLLRRTKWMQSIGKFLLLLWECFINLRLFSHRRQEIQGTHRASHWQLTAVILWYVLLTVAILVSVIILARFVLATVSWAEIGHVIVLGFITALRVLILIFLCSLLWIPLGVWIGLRPRYSNFAQPIIQFLASFPVNLVYPVAVIIIVNFHLDTNIWTSPLMILGSQWYIAFNVIAGTNALPKDLRQVASSLNVRGWLWWRKLILPGIFPYYVTGAITAAGGAWNASIIAEVVHWGHTELRAVGLGSYITHQTSSGDFARLALGIAVMCLYVLSINRVLWRPLYRLAVERFKLS
ncbi:MAG TPA: ABC transporter permease subunit [Gammaproteobacteria bacterium]|nr:ABC transporter permease subunit [Gammaproteobacteria bacterium]